MNQRTLPTLNRVPARRADYNSGVAYPTRSKEWWMVSIQKMGARSGASVVAVSVAIAALLSGCSMFGGREESSTPPPIAAAPATPTAAPEEDLTATETAIETAAAPAESAGEAPSSAVIRP